ncbi:MAG: guanylate kinase [Isosphaeraceae bacterium]
MAETREDWETLSGRLFVVSGPSGAGKSTVTKRLVEHPEVRARLSVSATTRQPRAGERQGVDYYFVDPPEFERMLQAGELLESAEVHGRLYGTPVQPVRETLAAGFCSILVIDVQGGLSVKKRVPNAVLVFLHAPSLDVLEGRLRTRGTDDDLAIARRLENARKEIEIARQHYPIHLINNVIDQAVNDLAALMVGHGCGEKA